MPAKQLPLQSLIHNEILMHNKTILIVDSGATKADWAVVQNGIITASVQSKGLSPIYQNEEEIKQEILNSVKPHLSNFDIDSIYFYGTGCIPEKIGIVKNGIYNALSINDIYVYSDLIAATHSLCGHDKGIACILGTGSNSCEWDGGKVINQISPLGFILGDEGSGAHLGKKLIGDALKNQLTAGLKEKLLEEYRLTPAQIIENVYRQPFPSRFLASFCPFLLKNKEDLTIKHIVKSGFGEFFERNVLQYDYKNNKVNFVGSIAFYFSEFLKEVASEKNIVIGNIYKSPMEGLVKYYSEN